ncbi:hypothetical protein UFOVP19_52 [uncultured Caudovirales phage]|uniref:Uncharacterized protein n=1 Tax=uncultured Caudovirales phage TaxID=2100421 RepID=A0A6J5KMM5_9CAUD|nr:hypothetical protein UFOVP19_52 [uncultured Caudovirales phage]
MSISRQQALALADGFINSLGEKPVKETEMPIINTLLTKFGGEFIINAQNNLIENKSIASGSINDIRFYIIQFGTQYTLTIGYPKNLPASKYYDYINKGVLGTKNEKADSSTPYKFNRAKKSIPISAADKWLGYNKLKVVSVKPYIKLGVETKAIESKKSLAYLVARAIHRKGIKSTHYFDNAAKETFGKNFYQVMEAALGKDIQIKIKQIGKELNNGNNNTK